MKAPTRIWIPVEEVIVGTKYMGYRRFDEPNSYHMCEVEYKGNGVGWIWCDLNQEIININYLERYTTFQEQDDWYKANTDFHDLDTQLNLLGLFHDMYDIADARHEMWNAWVCCDFYELNSNLKDEGLRLIGIAAAPYEWNIEGECCAYIVEDIYSTDLFWYHGAKDWIVVMRDQVTDLYEDIKKRW